MTTLKAIAKPHDKNANGKKLVFVTNNSTKSRKQYAKKFQNLGLEVSETGFLPFMRFLSFDHETFGEVYRHEFPLGLAKPIPDVDQGYSLKQHSCPVFNFSATYIHAIVLLSVLTYIA
ncbi:hypothetical protein Sjap_004667 [Stephania japonica]|uniref:Phosphoglycolate phosphatase n=1 Tax=Stephania japonica TaxID=461633 RepID=A0AAP0K3Z0_9MAGN